MLKAMAVLRGVDTKRYALVTTEGHNGLMNSILLDGSASPVQ